MEFFYLIARSVTHAQRMARALERCGIRSGVMRAPAALTDSGCAYAVRVRRSQAEEARACLQREQLRPLHIYTRGEAGYREVIW